MALRKNIVYLIFIPISFAFACKTLSTTASQTLLSPFTYEELWNLQMDLFRFRQDHGYWPEMPSKLIAYNHAHDSVGHSFENFTKLSWQDDRDTLRVNYLLEQTVSDTLPQLVTGRLNLFLSADTVFHINYDLDTVRGKHYLLVGEGRQ